MVCKVCKKELDSPICSFCGEDNSKEFYAQNKSESTPSRIKNSRKLYGKKKKLRINFKRVFVLAVSLLVLIFAVRFVISLFKSDDSKSVKTEKTLFSSGMLAVKSDGLWGYLSSDGKASYKIEPKFTLVTNFYGDFSFADIRGKFAMINKDGTAATMPDFDAVGKASANGLIPAKQGDLWGYINEYGTFVTDPKFTTASVFAENNIAAVSVSGSYGYIGEDGEYVIAPQYDTAGDFSSDGFAAVSSDGKYMYIDADGNSLGELTFDYACEFKNGFGCVKSCGDYGAVDSEGNMVIPAQFDKPFEFDANGYAKICVGGKYGIIDKSGNFVINPRYRDLGDFNGENLTFARRGDGKYGFIDMKDKFVISPEYNDAGNFSCGLAPVKSGESWGYINEKGETVIDAKYSFATQFYSDGYACVADADGGYMIIDTDGKNVFADSLKIQSVMLGDFAK